MENIVRPCRRTEGGFFRFPDGTWAVSRDSPYSLTSNCAEKLCCGLFWNFATIFHRPKLHRDTNTIAIDEKCHCHHAKIAFYILHRPRHDWADWERLMRNRRVMLVCVWTPVWDWICHFVLQCRKQATRFSVSRTLTGGFAKHRGFLGEGIGRSDIGLDNVPSVSRKSWLKRQQ